ncbi:MAG: PAS domain-containing protein [Steroidobacteraceae bacterium]
MDAPTGSDSSLSHPTPGPVAQGIESVLNLVGVGVWEHLLPENLAHHSDGLYHLVGVEPAIGRRVADFWRRRVHPDDQARQELAYSDFRQGLAPTYEGMYRVHHDQGHWVSVLARARWTSRGQDRVGLCILGYVIDVTALNADFDRLRAREERFRMSVSAVPGVVYDLDLRTHKSERHGLKRMLGYDSLQGEDGYGGWLAIVHPDDHARVTQQLTASRSGAENYSLTYRVRHQDGSWRHVQQRGTYMLGQDGSPIRAYGIIEDITAAEAQREQLQMQAAIIERMSDGVMLLAGDGAILFANPALEKMFGYGRGQMNGLHSGVLSFRSAENFEGLLRTVFAGTDNDRTSIIDLEGRHRNNSLCPVQGYFSSLQLGDQRCVVAVITDIAERQKLERELMQVATRVQQRIGGDLHEGLGQQLAGIAMMLQGLGARSGNAGTPALQSEIDGIVALVNAAIRSTRSLARGLSPVRPTHQGLIEGFEELVNQVDESYHIRVQLDLQLPPDLQLDEDCATNLYRIAQEGVLNAARHADAESIRLRLRVAGPDVELLVVDDGKGFDPLQFARGGMGLRIMRFRAQLIGGYLSIESRPSGGTTLRCRCPLRVNREVA